MKTKSSDAKKHRAIAILLLTVTIALGSIPSALAANTPNVSPLPTTVTLNGNNIIKVTADPNKLAHNRATLSMFDPNVTVFGSNFIDGNGNCRSGPPTGGTQWELRHSSDLTTPVVYTMSSVGDSFKVNFGTDGIVTIFDITGTTTVSTTSAKWVDTSGGSDPAKYDILTNPIDPFDAYEPHSCGFENVGQGTQAPYDAEASIYVVQPVGGSIITIDATSLVLAGIFTNAFWFLPIVGVASAAGIGIYRLRK